MWTFAIVVVDEGVEPGLPLQDVPLLQGLISAGAGRSARDDRIVIRPRAMPGRSHHTESLLRP